MKMHRLLLAGTILDPFWGHGPHLWSQCSQMKSLSALVMNSNVNSVFRYPSHSASSLYETGFYASFEYWCWFQFQYRHEYDQTTHVHSTLHSLNMIGFILTQMGQAYPSYFAYWSAYTKWGTTLVRRTDKGYTEPWTKWRSSVSRLSRYTAAGATNYLTTQSSRYNICQGWQSAPHRWTM